MKRVNRLVLLFFATISIFLFGFWEVLQSEVFAQNVSGRITKLIKKELNSEIEFENLNFKIFPPGAELKNVKTRSIGISDENFKASLNLEVLGVYFNIIDFLANKISIKKILFKNGKISVESSLFQKTKGKSGSFLDIVKSLQSKNEVKPTEKIKGLPFNFAEVNGYFRKNLPFLIRALELSDINLSVDGIALGQVSSKLDFASSYFDYFLNIKTREQTGLKFLDTIDQMTLNCRFQSQELIVKKILLNKKINTFHFAGNIKGDFKNFTKLNVLGEGDLILDALSVEREFKLWDELIFKKGYLESRVKISGMILDPNFTVKLKGSSIDTDYLKLENLDLDFQKRGEKIFLSKLKISHNGESAEILKRVPIFDLSKKRPLRGEATMLTNSLEFGTALYSLRKNLSSLTGEINGRVDLKWDFDSIVFDFTKSSNIKNLALGGKEGKTIFNFKEVKPELLKIKLNFDDLSVGFDVDANIGESKVVTRGVINKNGANFISEENFVNLEDLGEIAGIKFKGAGPVRLSVITKKNQTNLIFNLNLKQAEAFNIKLGNFKSNIILNTHKQKLVIQKASGRFNDSAYEGAGFLDFSKVPDSNINFTMLEGTYKDTLGMLGNFIGEESAIPKNILMTYKADVKVSGPLTKEGILIRASLNSKEILYLGENFTSADIKFKLKNQKLSFTDFLLKKGAGEVSGRFEYDLNSHGHTLDGSLKDIELREFDFYKKTSLSVNGSLKGVFNSQGKKEKFNSKINLQVDDGTIAGESIPQSWLNLMLNEKSYNFELNFMKGLALAEGFIDPLQSKSDKRKKSWLKVRFDFDDINRLIGSIASHNLINKNLKGYFYGDIYSQFNILRLSELNFSAVIKDFSMSREKVSVRINPKRNRVNIDNGVLKEWDIELDGQNGGFISKGTGSFNKNFSIRNDLHVDGSLAEIASSHIKNAEGKIVSNLKIHGKNDLILSQFNSTGSGINISINNIPGEFKDIKFSANYSDEKIILEYLDGRFANGVLSGGGEVKFGGLIPEVDINVLLKDAQLKIKKKSHLLVSGKSRLYGDSLPYVLNGDFSIPSGLVADELNEFIDKTAVDGGYKKFIPLVDEDNNFRLLNLDIGLVSDKGIAFKNSLGEMVFIGKARVSGSPLSYKINGKFEILPGSGRFYFKANDFILKKGTIWFDETDTTVKPHFDFLGVSQFKDYDISLGVLGVPSKFDINLFSEPPLAQNDILSLLAYGFTEEASQGIDETSRQSLTSMGIGNLLLDRFQIGQGIKSSLGVNLSLTPEFTDNEESLLQGRSTNQKAGNAKSKSATVIKVQKKLNNAVNLSVSSTVGNDSNQKQEMNLEYSLKKNLSVQGVYEVRDNDGSEDISSPTSVGADLKWRIPFK